MPAPQIIASERGQDTAVQRGGEFFPAAFSAVWMAGPRHLNPGKLLFGSGVTIVTGLTQNLFSVFGY